MPYGIYLAASGADAQSERLKVLSHNLANVDTPGFKRELAVIEAVPAEAIERGEAIAGTGSINDAGGGVAMAETVTDFSQGGLTQTGVATDMAIDGDGFFVVAKDGEQMLTRAGNFRLSPTGQLQSDQGFPVLSSGGEPIEINPSLPWRLTEDGRISQQGVQLPLALVQPAALGDLVKTGQNLFASLGELQPLAPSERRVLNGYLERSTVKPTLEMMQLIETSRAYEANVRMIQSNNQMLSALINRALGQR